MWILMLEAGVALFLLVFIVWWTMFAGRKPEQAPRAQEARRGHDGGDDGGDNKPAA